MSNTEKENKQLDIVDEIKKIEQTIRRKALLNVINDIKAKARKIIELKEETSTLLESLGINDIDSKRVIDFVNSLPDTQLSDSDKKDIKEKMSNEAKKQKTAASKKIEDAPITLTNYSNWLGSAPPVTSAVHRPTLYMTSGDTLVCDNTTSGWATSNTLTFCGSIN